MATVLSTASTVASPHSPSLPGGKGKPPVPDTWHTDRYRDPIRYYRCGENGPDSWETCKKLSGSKTTEALLAEWEQTRHELDQWMERAQQVLDEGNTKPMHDLFFAKTPPHIIGHLAIPTLFEYGILPQWEVDEYMAQALEALTLAVRINVRYLLDHKNEPAVEHPQSVHCDHLAGVAEDAGIDVRLLEEWPSYEPERAAYRAMQQKVTAEISTRRSEPPRLKDTGG